METLLRGLTEPVIKSDGVMRPPTSVMLRAAKALQELHTLIQANQQVLMAKQTECEKAHQYGIGYMLRYEALRQPLDISAYQEAMNKDRE